MLVFTHTSGTAIVRRLDHVPSWPKVALFSLGVRRDARILEVLPVGFHVPAVHPRHTQRRSVHLGKLVDRCDDTPPELKRDTCESLRLLLSGEILSVYHVPVIIAREEPALTQFGPPASQV